MRTYPLEAPERILSHWKVPVQTTSSFVEGAVVPIPIFPVESVVPVPFIPLPKIRFQIFKTLLLAVFGTSTLYPRTILFEPVDESEPA